MPQTERLAVLGAGSGRGISPRLQCVSRSWTQILTTFCLGMFSDSQPQPAPGSLAVCSQISLPKTLAGSALGGGTLRQTPSGGAANLIFSPLLLSSPSPGQSKSLGVSLSSLAQCLPSPGRNRTDRREKMGGREREDRQPPGTGGSCFPSLGYAGLPRLLPAVPSSPLLSRAPSRTSPLPVQKVLLWVGQSRDSVPQSCA